MRTTRRPAANTKVNYEFHADLPESPLIHLPKWLFVAHDGGMSTRERPTPSGLDDVSRAIIEQLQQDGRRPYSAIGRAVGLSEAAVRQRVQRLIDLGVMQVVAVTDPMQVGFPRAAMIGIRVTGDLVRAADEIERFPEVDYLVITAGSYDLLAEVVCEDDEHLLETLNNKIRSVAGVSHTETFIYLQLRKQIYTWGTR